MHVRLENEESLLDACSYDTPHSRQKTLISKMLIAASFRDVAFLCGVPLAVRGKMPHGNQLMTDADYVVMTVKCARCATKQKVHVTVSTGNRTQLGDQTVQCVQCGNSFKVSLPDKIIRGPFPA